MSAFHYHYHFFILENVLFLHYLFFHRFLVETNLVCRFCSTFTVTVAFFIYSGELNLYCRSLFGDRKALRNLVCSDCVCGGRFKTFVSCYRTPGPQKGSRKVSEGVSEGISQGLSKGFRRGQPRTLLKPF